MLKLLKAYPLEASAILISCVALLATFMQAEMTRKHNRLSVIPIIHFNSSETDHKLSITNNGLGPAIIKGIEFKKIGVRSCFLPIVAVVSPDHLKPFEGGGDAKGNKGHPSIIRTAKNGSCDATLS